MKLSVIIVSYNVKYFLEQCLSSVQRAMAGIDAEVWVVDNCSIDNSIEYLQQKYFWVNFISNANNEGFAKANNTALKQCTGEYVLFLNPDTIISENILKQCLRFFETHNDAGAIGVQMIDGSGSFLPESKRSFPSATVSFNKLSGLSSVFSSSAYFNKYALGNLDKNKVHVVDVLSGAFMMIERKLLLELNGFDEAFFMYGEDIDLSYRIQQTGKQNYYLGNLCIVHFKGESIGSNRSRHTKIFYNAMHVFVKKHYKGINSIGLKLLLRSGILLRTFISFIGNPVRKLSAKPTSSATEKETKVHLVGDIVATEEAEKIMLKHKLQKAFKGSIMIEKQVEFGSISGAEVIFCIGRFSCETAIAIIKNQPKRNRYMWHGTHTSSIVGSANKRNAGLVYTPGNTNEIQKSNNKQVFDSSYQ